MGENAFHFGGELYQHKVLKGTGTLCPWRRLRQVLHSRLPWLGVGSTGEILGSLIHVLQKVLEVSLTGGFRTRISSYRRIKVKNLIRKGSWRCLLFLVLRKKPFSEVWEPNQSFSMFSLKFRWFQSSWFQFLLVGEDVLEVLLVLRNCCWVQHVLSRRFWKATVELPLRIREDFLELVEHELHDLALEDHVDGHVGGLDLWSE